VSGGQIISATRNAIVDISGYGWNIMYDADTRDCCHNSGSAGKSVAAIWQTVACMRSHTGWLKWLSGD
jgi:hypothetical protein